MSTWHPQAPPPSHPTAPSARRHPPTHTPRTLWSLRYEERKIRAEHAPRRAANAKAHAAAAAGAATKAAEKLEARAGARERAAAAAAKVAQAAREAAGGVDAALRPVSNHELASRLAAIRAVGGNDVCAE